MFFFLKTIQKNKLTDQHFLNTFISFPNDYTHNFNKLNNVQQILLFKYHNCLKTKCIMQYLALMT